MVERTYKIEGMSCGHCEAAVEGELGRLPGLERSNADFERGTVEVRYDGDRVSADDIGAAVEEAGYALVL